ncbi:hypothetical protein CTAM01_11166 [Colletotrichum tamarilloi]|uniref:Uncharacterized protein n=1 Tax=Colletotrichum tamarilloi TaxID=1209934 RepID=A0ABQ9QYF1_9PEZI|nr:hypothetical protein CTAM01_11166 [Colletotrichum tamarilloi]
MLTIGQSSPGSSRSSAPERPQTPSRCF